MDKARHALDSVTWYNGLAPVAFSWTMPEYIDRQAAIERAEEGET